MVTSSELQAEPTIKTSSDRQSAPRQSTSIRFRRRLNAALRFSVSFVYVDSVRLERSALGGCQADGTHEHRRQLGMTRLSCWRAFGASAGRPDTWAWATPAEGTGYFTMLNAQWGTCLLNA